MAVGLVQLGTLKSCGYRAVLDTAKLLNADSMMI